MVFYMINQNVLICGVVKNGEKTIGANVAHCVKTMELFNQGKIIIYENNSTDNTKQILNQINHPNILVISEDISASDIKRKSKIWAYTRVTGSDHPCRIEQIANARNSVLNEINKPEYDDYTYVIWIDLDSSGWDLNGISDSFSRADSWDIVYANGQDCRGMYYDLYAFRGESQLFGPEILGEYFWGHMPSLRIYQPSELIPVISAFGGLGIYKKAIFKTISYDCIVNEEVKKFYRMFLEKHPLRGEMIKIASSEDAKFSGGQKDEVVDIFWKNNSGYDKPVICEHVCFNLAAINAGYRLFINPTLKYSCSDR